MGYYGLEEYDDLVDLPASVPAGLKGRLLEEAKKLVARREGLVRERAAAEKEHALYLKAKAGDVASIKRFMMGRRGGEYERIEVLGRL